MRAQGRGTQRKDGRWATSVTLPDGRKRYLYADSQRALLAQAAKLRQAIAEGTAGDDSKRTVADYLDEWLETIRDQVRPPTYRHHEQVVRLHLVPVLGKTRLSKLSALEIQRLYTALLRAGKAPGTVRNVHLVLHAALKQAHRWRLVRENVADFADPPRYVPYESKTLSPEQVRTLIAGCREERLEALYVLGLLGLRQGEILALRWSDIDFDACLLTVRVGLSRGADGQPVVTETKTRSSHRTVWLPAPALAALQRRREAQTAERLVATTWLQSALVFTDLKGQPIKSSGLLREHWYPLLTRLGLPRIRYHDLRHTVGTVVSAWGLSPRATADLLGHASPKMTLDTYSHGNSATQDATREALRRLFGDE